MKYISEYVLSIAGIIILNVLVESVMPSNAFKKYIKAIMGLIIIIVLAKPLLNFTDFEIYLDRFVLSEDFELEESSEIEDVLNKNIESQFEKQLCVSIKNDIIQNFNVTCEVYAKYEDNLIKKVEIKCDDEKFTSIKSFIDKKYGVSCTKRDMRY